MLCPCLYPKGQTGQRKIIQTLSVLEPGPPKKTGKILGPWLKRNSFQNAEKDQLLSNV